MDLPDDPFWLFSLDLYGRPGVAEACLALQDGSGADVNLVLFVLWCAATERPLDAETLTRLDEQVAAWRHAVVEPLRKVRRGMKVQLLPGLNTETLRSEIKAAELAAERLVQAALFAAAPAPGNVPEVLTAAREGLAGYGARLPSPLTEAPVAVLLDALRRR